MAEDEETATARYIASNVSTQLMLKTMFEIIATMADDPDGYRSDMRTKLLEIADTMPLAPMAAGARKEGPSLRQGDGRHSVDQPAAQLGRRRWRRGQRQPKTRSDISPAVLSNLERQCPDALGR